MNILFSCDEYPPIKSGGIGTVTKIVAEELAHRGHHVYVISGVLPNVQIPKVSITNGVTVYRLKYFALFSPLFGDPKFKEETLVLKLLRRFGILSFLSKLEFVHTHRIIKEIIEENNIDLVEFPDYLKLSDYYRSRRLIDFPKYTIPVVARVHGCQSFASYYRDGRISEIDRYNDTSFFKSVTSILAVSKFSASFITDKLGVNRSIDVIYNPIDLESIKRDASCLQFKDSPEGRTIVFIGKIVETKGAFNLILAFNQFAQSYPDYNLIMIGGGDIERGQSLVKSDVKERVHFTGYLPREEVYASIINSSFCVVPSFYENFSMVALEIMALGKALIYTKEASGIEVVEDGVDGLLVNPHDVKEIVSKMNVLANNDALRHSLGIAAAKKIETKFSLKVVVSELEEYYNRIIS